MKKVALFVSAALLAAVVSTNANAGGCEGYYEYAAMRCAWWRGEYEVKGFDTTAYSYITEPTPHSSCLVTESATL